MARARWRRSRGDTAAALDLQSPGPIGKVLAWLDHNVEPELPLGDWPRHFLRQGDTAEINVIGKLTGREETVGRFLVTAANSKHFKISDGRSFDQAEGWPLLSGKKSRVRARRARS